MSGPRPVVLSGPSGAGKSTLLKRLLQEHGSIFGFSVSREAWVAGAGGRRVSGMLGVGPGHLLTHPWGSPTPPRSPHCTPLPGAPTPTRGLSQALQRRPCMGVGAPGSQIGHRCLFLDTTRDPRPGEENGKGELTPWRLSYLRDGPPHRVGRQHAGTQEETGWGPPSLHKVPEGTSLDTHATPHMVL